MIRNTISLASKRGLATTAPLQKIIPEAMQTTPGKRPEPQRPYVAEDTAAKAMDAVVDRAIYESDLAGGKHEVRREEDAVVQKLGGADAPMFNADDATEKQFNADKTLL